VDYQKARELLLHHLRYSGGVDLAKAHEGHHDDAVLEFPSRASASWAKPTSSAGASSTQHESPTSRASSGKRGPLDDGGPGDLRRRQPAPVRLDR
jgi:hypothetical protein